MKEHLTLLLISSIFFIANANNNILNENDLSQDTILKTISLYSDNYNRNFELQDSVLITEKVGDRNFKIKPNQIKKTLGIEIWGGNSDEELRLILYNEIGYTLIIQTAINGHNPIDLSEFSKGTYVLRIVSNKDKKEFKIIKD